MTFIKENYLKIKPDLSAAQAGLVAVSKIRTAQEIMEAYQEGQRDFGENYVQELVAKYEVLPQDIRWHFIGHLQSNKIKLIVPFIYLIHGVDSEKLLAAINREAQKVNRVVSCLLQIHIAKEETKFGFNEDEALDIEPAHYPFVNIRGLMGMATLTDDMEQLRSEFRMLKTIFEEMKPLFSEHPLLSMGMSSDYMIALEEGSNLVRIGSLLFGERVAK